MAKGNKHRNRLIVMLFLSSLFFWLLSLTLLSEKASHEKVHLFERHTTLSMSG